MIKNYDEIIANANASAFAKKIVSPINSQLTLPDVTSKTIPAMRFKQTNPTAPSPFVLPQVAKVAPYQLDEQPYQFALPKQDIVPYQAPVQNQEQPYQFALPKQEPYQPPIKYEDFKAEPYTSTPITPYAVAPLELPPIPSELDKFNTAVAETNYKRWWEETAVSAQNIGNTTLLNVGGYRPSVEMEKTKIGLLALNENNNMAALIAKTSQGSAPIRKKVFDENQERRNAIAQRYVGQSQSGFEKNLIGVSSAIVEMAPMIVGNLILPGSGYAIMFANVAENEYQTALQDGASESQAQTFGVLKGGIEVFTSAIIGGISVGGMKGIADVTGFKAWLASGVGGLIDRSLGNIASTALSKKLISQAIDTFGEGAEEYISQVMGDMVVGVYKKPTKTLLQSMTSQEAWDAWFMGSLTSAVMAGGAYASGKSLQAIAKTSKIATLSVEENLSIAQTLVKQFGADLVMIDVNDNRNGAFIPGKDGTNDTIYINEQSRRALGTVALHETGHLLINSAENGKEVVQNFLSIYYDGKSLQQDFTKLANKYQNFYDQQLVMDKNTMTKEALNSLDDNAYADLVTSTVKKYEKERRVPTQDELFEEMFTETMEKVIDDASGMRRLMGKQTVADKIRLSLGKVGAKLAGDENALVVQQMQDIFNMYADGYKTAKQIEQKQMSDLTKQQMQPQTQLGRLLAQRNNVPTPQMASLSEETKNPSNITEESKQALEGLKTSQAKLSVSEDTKGRTLTKEQSEYFKDTKVVDEEGKLLEVYHGTDSSFTAFDADKTSISKKMNGYGIYFSPSYEVANHFGGNVQSVFLDIKNPLESGQQRFPISKYIEIIKSIDAKNGAFIYDGKESKGGLDTVIRKVKSMYDGNDETGLYARMFRFYNPKYHSSLQNEFANILGVDGAIDRTITEPNKYGSMSEEYRNEMISKQARTKNNINEIVVFNPNQIKYTDNLNPTTSKDMRFSIEEDAKRKTPIENPTAEEKTAFQKFTDDRIKGFDDLYNEVIKEVGTENKEEVTKQATIKILDKYKEPFITPLELDPEEKRALSTHAKTLADSGLLSTHLKADVIENFKNDEYTHIIKGDKSAIRTAKLKVELNGFDNTYDELQGIINSDHRIHKADIVLADVLMAYARNTKDDTQIAKMMVLVGDLTAIGTDFGQGLQALGMISKFTSIGKVRAFDKMLNRMKIVYSKKGKNGVKIDFDFTEAMQERMLLETDSQKVDDIIDEYKIQLVQAMPSTWLDKANAWRYMSMLGNPRTHIRNILGNAAVTPLRVMSNAIASNLEVFIPKADRTHAILLPTVADKALRSFAAEQFEEVKNLVEAGGKYDMRSELEQQKRIFKNDAFEWSRKAVFNALEAEDAFALKKIFRVSLAQYMKAKGLTATTITPAQLIEARDYASQDAKRFTFRNASTLASFLNRIEQGNDTIGAKALGLVVTATVPFKKTPINILKLSAQFSPLGLIYGSTVGLSQVRSGKITANEFIEQISEGITGTGVALLGAFLSSAGILSVGQDDDEAKRAAEHGKATGYLRYALNIGGYSYSVDWAVPMVLPLILGAELQHQFSKNKDSNLLQGSIDLLVGMFDPIFELSMLQGVLSTMQSFSSNGVVMLGETAIKMAENYVGQFVPTLGGQIARIVDPVRRSTYAPANSKIPPVIETFLRRMANKIPLASLVNAPMVNVRGEEVTQPSNIIIRSLTNLLSPGYLAEKSLTEQDKELIELFDLTKDATVFPMVTAKNFVKDGMKYILNNKEYADFAKTMGTTSYDLLKKLIQTNTYKVMSPDDRKNIVNDLYEYARSKSQSEYLSGKQVAITDKAYLKISSAEGYGVSAVDYTLAKYAFNSLDGAIDKKRAFIAKLVDRGYNYEKVKYLLTSVGSYKITDADYTFLKSRISARK